MEYTFIKVMKKLQKIISYLVPAVVLIPFGYYISKFWLEFPTLFQKVLENVEIILSKGIF